MQGSGKRGAGARLRHTVYLYSMPVTVVPMRKRGVPINPHMREAGAFIGHLQMHNYNDPVLHRMVRRVDLLEPNPHGQCKPMLPPLLDASLVTLGDKTLVLTGFERLNDAAGRPVDFAQSCW